MASISSRPRIVDYFAWALLVIAVLFAAYVRGRLREFPLERDEGEFAYAGQLILQGVPPYKLAYNMKLPGTYIAYAALMAVFGQTTPGIHLGLLAVNIATIVLLFFFVREIFGAFSAGIAALAFSILSVSQSFLGMAAHATHFVAFFGLAGTYLLWRHLNSGGTALQSEGNGDPLTVRAGDENPFASPQAAGAQPRIPLGRWWQALAGGLLMGIAFLMKQQGVFLMVFGGAAMATYTVVAVVMSSRRRSFSARQLFQLILNLVLYCAAAVLPYLLICLWLWRAGVFETFWFWTVTYASKYVAEIPFSLAIASLSQNAPGFLVPNWPLSLLALVGIAGVAILGSGKPGLRAFIFGFLLFSFICTCPGFYFRQHYFIVMLPAVAIFIGAGSGLLWDLASGRFWKPEPAISRSSPQSTPPPGGRRKRTNARQGKPDPRPMPSNVSGSPLDVVVFILQALVAFLLLAAVSGTLWIQRDFLFNWPPLFACRVTYNSNPFLEAPEIAKYLKDHTAPDDTIAVLGSEPEIFFDAQRRSATGYIYTYGLVEVQPLALKMQNEMIKEIEDAKPKYIVFANVRCSWLTQPNSETKILQWAGDYLMENYTIVGIMEPRSPLDTTALWDDRVQLYQKPTKPTELDLQWKLTAFQNAPATYNYWRMPYMLVLKRKK
jgi:hypothetical protein